MIATSGAGSPVPLTAMQHRLMVLLQRLLHERGGVGPSYEELRVGLGLSSKSGVSRLVSACIERGRIERLPNTVRSLRVVVPVDDDLGVAIYVPTGLDTYSDGDILVEAARRGLIRA